MDAAAECFDHREQENFGECVKEVVEQKLARKKASAASGGKKPPGGGGGPAKPLAKHVGVRDDLTP